MHECDNPLFYLQIVLQKAIVDIWARANVTLDIGLHVVGVRTVGVRRLRHNQIFSDG